MKFSDLKNNRLYIRRQAINEGVKEWAKTANGYRDIPLTQNALKILEDVKAFNEEHGYNAEWIFQSGNADYKLFKTGFFNMKKAGDGNRINQPLKKPYKIERKTALYPMRTEIVPTCTIIFNKFDY